MITVILRDGRALKYNEAMYLNRSGGEYTLRKEKGTLFFIACFPFDVVERIETVKPCQILKESRNKKKMKKY